jgi:signal transduction histidine kinase
MSDDASAPAVTAVAAVAAKQRRTIRDEVLRAQLRPVLALAAAAAALVVLLVLGQYGHVRMQSTNALDDLDAADLQTVLRQASTTQMPVLMRWVATYGLRLPRDESADVPDGHVRLPDGRLVPLNHLMCIVVDGSRIDPLDGRSQGAAPPAWLYAIAALPPDGWVRVPGTLGADEPGRWSALLIRLDDRRVAAIASPNFEMAPLDLLQLVAWFGLISAAGVGAFVALFLLVFRRRFAARSAARLSAPVERLAGAVRAAARAGDASCRVAPEGPVEVAALAQDFNDLQARLGQAISQREVLIASQRDLVASLSHELRTPLAVLRGHAEVLTREPASASAAGTMLRQIEDLHRLLSDLLDMARLESIEATLVCEDVPVQEVVDEMVQRFGAAGWRHGVLVRAGDAPPESAGAHADPRWLRQIAANLLSNAIRHTPPGGLVTVCAGVQGARVRLVVEDSGVGLAAGAIAHDVTGRGAGIGLRLVQRLAAAMQGSLHLEATAEGGTRAVVLLPRAARSSSG